MGLFDKLTTDNLEQDKDFIGGGLLDSGAYDMVVEMAYVDTSKAGAINVNFTFKDSSGRTLKVTEYVTNRKGENFYTKGNSNYPLPGFTTVNNVCLLGIGKPLSELDTEEKTLSLYNFDVKKEMPMAKQVITDLLGAEITLGVIKSVVDKNTKQADGSYAPSGETREVNEVDKVFRHGDHFTVAEIISEDEEATYYDGWVGKYTGIVRNKAKGTKGSGGSATTTVPKPTQSLFGK